VSVPGDWVMADEMAARCAADFGISLGLAERLVADVPVSPEYIRSRVVDGVRVTLYGEAARLWVGEWRERVGQRGDR